jgi:pilus assembly protein CpaE
MVEEEKIRVLIVDDIAETRENIRKLLQFENDFDVVGAARNGREGIELAKETRPDVILMDINMPDIDGITATETIRQALSFTQIIILTVQGDPNYMRRAMLAGARDFLTKPPSVDEMTSAIRRAGRIAHEERSKTRILYPGKPGAGVTGSLNLPIFQTGKVIAVYGPKGGVGCTTIAVNLGIALHKDESPVVIVDGDMEFGDVAVFVNQQGKNSIIDLAPRADELDPEIIEEVSVLHQASGIKILTAPSRPEFSESVDGEQFGKVLDYLRNLYAYVIVDCASSLTDVTLAAIDSADLILLLTTQEIPAIKDARLFLDLLSSLKIPRERLLFVMNKYDKRLGITPQKIGESFKQEVHETLPLDERVVLPSINRGIPFVMGDKSKPITRSLFSLKEAVRKRLSPKEEQVGADAAAAPVRGRPVLAVGRR